MYAYSYVGLNENPNEFYEILNLPRRNKNKYGWNVRCSMTVEFLT